jgi:sec-independent protein translocase protein TatA
MFTLAFGFGGPWDIAIVAAVVILLFGGTKIAGLGKSMGEGIKEFKKATKDDDEPSGPSQSAVVSTPPPAAIGSKTEETTRS